MNARYPGIDLVKLIFAMLIPLLHIVISNPVVVFIQQYISRLGVPFFFAVSGMFLYQNVEKKAFDAWKKYVKRIGLLLAIWLAVYSIPLYISLSDEQNFFQILIFKTPAYLWYLTALLTASVPFCFIKNRKVLHKIAVLIYVGGCLIGEGYLWLTGGCEIYNQLFLTTRNGIFFALPLMCVGEVVLQNEYRGKAFLLITVVLLIVEITLVIYKTPATADRSMYLMLPIFEYHLINLAKNVKLNINTNEIRTLSSAIYLMQYGIITVVSVGFSFLGINTSFNSLLIYFAVIFIPYIFCKVLKKQRFIKYIF